MHNFKNANEPPTLATEGKNGIPYPPQSITSKHCWNRIDANFCMFRHRLPKFKTSYLFTYCFTFILKFTISNERNPL